MSDSGTDSSDMGEQVRISLTLSADCQNRDLKVPSEPIAVPADIGRKGLSAVINHLLDRRLTSEKDDDDDSDGDDENDDRLPAINFDFILGKNNKLLRTALEREARRTGLSLEESIPVTYFPAQKAPELTGESDPLPDWVSALSYSPSSHLLAAGCYDGSLQLFQTKDREGNAIFERLSIESSTIQGPIKCVATMTSEGTNIIRPLWIATGSMDHSLLLHEVDVDAHEAQAAASCTHGHASSIASVDFSPSDQTLASGDWDGGVCLWKVGDAKLLDPTEGEQPSKKSRTGSKSKKLPGDTTTNVPQQSPIVSLQAHSSQVSGLSWGNFEKKNSSNHGHLITASWDHSLKVWNVERQDCVLTLNGSRVVSCLDTSYFSAGIAATGHPDCTIRLWDVRTGNGKESALSIADTTFRPSHKAWVSAVQWSRSNPYHLASTSHDGVVKTWDIRSPLPLHSARAFPKTEKAFALAYGNTDSGVVYAGGTDCIVKQFRSGNGSDAATQ